MDDKGSFKVAGNIVNILTKEIFWGEVEVENGKIKTIQTIDQRPSANQPFIIPGFIDSHVHIESSMLVPSEFAKLAVVHGTVATVSDPHEIANVCGLEGVDFMIENGKTVPFKFNFGAPSCVPATIFETAGAELNAEAVKKLLEREEVKYLSEMMNFPGVLHGDVDVMAKIKAAHDLGKPVDGHAPGLRGEDARRYVMASPNPSERNASPNPSEGGTLDSDNSNNVYDYLTADPVTYGLLKEFVKKHRSNPTDAEIAVWELLRGKQLDGYKFRRQHIIGNYIADFVCLPAKLIIEVDGLIHQIPENKISDAKRTVELNKYGFEVIRFNNIEVINERAKVADKILTAVSKRKTESAVSEIPPPAGGGGGAVISTDHECFTKEEAIDKLSYGMKIIIREGSAAKNFDALVDLIDEYPDMILLCSDDKHPDSLVDGHINQLCARAVAKGKNVFNVLKAACVNPVLHYKLDVGLLQISDDADFIVVDDLKNFHVQQTYINGELVAENGKSLIVPQTSTIINHFNCSEKSIADFEFHLNKFGPNDAENIEQVYVIEALDGQLITNKIIAPLSSFEVVEDIIHANIEKDFLYMVVVNRYHNAPVAKCFIKNFGFKKGAIASSVAHDSHNIIAVGVDAESICKAVNLVIKAKGGVSAVADNELIVELPVAGLMSNEDGYKVAIAYSAVDAMAKEMGSTLAAPFMTLSFMALLVIPHLKLSDKGLFDGDRFQIL
jgi:adenine deaminase